MKDKITMNNIKKNLHPEEKKALNTNYAQIHTEIDTLVSLAKKYGPISFTDMAEKLKWSPDEVEKVALVLETAEILDVVYPALPTDRPKIKFLKEAVEKEIEKVDGEIIDKYEYEVDFVPIKVNIRRKTPSARPVYELVVPDVGPNTKAFLDAIKDEIAEEIPIEISEITDEKKSIKLKKKFFDISKIKLKSFFTDSKQANLDILSGMLLHMMYGLGKLELFMGDDNLEEVAINSSRTPVTIYHREYGWILTNITMDSESTILNFASQIGRKVGREINNLAPILDAHIVSGDRVNSTLAPISSFGNTMTIRRFSRRPWTLVDFIGRSHTMDSEMAALLWLAMQYEMSIIFAGGTASGKTSALNALSAFIPNYHRIISIEDVRELNLPEHMTWNWVPMTTRNANPEGLGEVSMLDLLQSSLRMRPDRIILGEMRRKREAEVLFEAMHTGHSVYSTLHANSAAQVVRRLTEAPMEIPPLEVEAIDLVVVQYRDRKSNRRRTYEIAEIDSGLSEGQISVNIIYKYFPRTDTWDKLNEPIGLLGKLNLHTGMTDEELRTEITKRQKVIEWMNEKDFKDIDQVGGVLKAYYSDPEMISNAAQNNLDPKDILGGKN